MKNNNTIHIILLSISGVVVSVLSYAYHPIMMGYLTLEEFWIFESLLSLLNLITVITLSISLFLVKELAKDINGRKTKPMISISIKWLNFFGILLFILFLLFSPFIRSFLQIKELNLIILTWTIIPLTFVWLYQWAFLQWKKEFTLISYTNPINPIAKVVLWFLMVYFWLNIYWALGGVIAGILVYIWIRYFIVENKLKQYSIQINERLVKQQILSSFLSQKKQILQYLFTSVLIALFMNIDILIVKNMFDGETAGYYAAVSVLAKFLVFLGLSIETVYYPQLVKEKVFPKLQILKISAYYIVLTLSSLVFFWLFGDIVLRLFKDGLQQYLPLIYPLLIYCGLLAYLSIIVKTLIAFEHYTINYLLGGLIVLLIIALYSFQSSPLLVTQIFALFGVGGLLLGISQVMRR